MQAATASGQSILSVGWAITFALQVTQLAIVVMPTKPTTCCFCTEGILLLQQQQQQQQQLLLLVQWKPLFPSCGRSAVSQKAKLARWPLFVLPQVSEQTFSKSTGKLLLLLLLLQSDGRRLAKSHCC